MMQLILCQSCVRDHAGLWVEASSCMCWRGGVTEHILVWKSWSWMVRGKDKLEKKAFQQRDLQVGVGVMRKPVPL